MSITGGGSISGNPPTLACSEMDLGYSTLVSAATRKRRVEFPDVEGTVAVDGSGNGYVDISSTQTITGQKTFSNAIGISAPIVQVTGTTDSSSSITGTLLTAGGAGIAKTLNAGGKLISADTTDSSSSSTGSILTSGGIGALKTITTDGKVVANDTTDASSSSTGSIITAGGLGVGKKLYVGSVNDSSSTTTGAMVCAGGLGLAKSLNVGGVTDSSGPSSGAITCAGGLGLTKSFYTGGIVEVQGTSDASSGSTGAIRTLGGIGVTKSIWCGATVTGVNLTASSAVQGATVTSTGNMTVGATFQLPASTLKTNAGSNTITFPSATATLVNDTSTQSIAGVKTFTDKNFNLRKVGGQNYAAINYLIGDYSFPSGTNTFDLFTVTINAGGFSGAYCEVILNGTFNNCVAFIYRWELGVVSQGGTPKVFELGSSIAQNTNFTGNTVGLQSAAGALALQWSYSGLVITFKVITPNTSSNGVYSSSIRLQPGGASTTFTLGSSTLA